MCGCIFGSRSLRHPHPKGYERERGVTFYDCGAWQNVGHSAMVFRGHQPGAAASALVAHYLFKVRQQNVI